ncbi:hypothetical protein V8E36_000021 [Tilletia maclaganii]
MLHILAPYIIANLALSATQLVFAATQTGLLFTRLPSSSSSSQKNINTATAIVIPAIYGACTVASIIVYLTLIAVHIGELRKGQLSTAAWRTAKVLVWVVVGLTALQLLSGVVTIGFNYSGSNHFFTDGSKAFNRPFTITFIIYNGLALLHIGLLMLYKQRVLSQGPRPKGSIGDDYERVGVEFSGSIRRANRVQDSSDDRQPLGAHNGDDGDEMRERLPVSGADAGLAPPSRHIRFQSPSSSSIPASSPVRSSYASAGRHHQQYSSHADSATGLRRQNSSAGYADYDEEDEDEGDQTLQPMHPPHDRYSHSRFSSYGTQQPLSHAQQPSFGSTSSAFPQQHQQQQQPLHMAHASNVSTTGPAPAFPTARLYPDYTGTTGLPAYSEPGYTSATTPAAAYTGPAPGLASSSSRPDHI